MKINGSNRRRSAGRAPRGSGAKSRPSSAKVRKTRKPAPRPEAVTRDSFESSGKPGKVIRSNAAVIRGTAGDDIIYGGNASQRIIGGGGNDIIIGGGGGDRILGGDGNDRIRGGAGGDTVRGGRGEDRISGGRGNDTLRGDDGADRLAGEIGDDHVTGGRGNDHGTGGMGIDVLHGGEGNDVQGGDAGPDFIHGGQGNDTVSFQTQTGAGFDPSVPNSGVRVEGNQASSWRSTHEGIKYSGSAYGGSRAGGGSGVDGLESNENVVGSTKDDKINGDFTTVEGGPGRDLATGRVRSRVSANGEPDRRVSTRGAVVDVFRSKLTGGTTLRIAGGQRNDDITVRRSGEFVTVHSKQGLAARGGGQRIDANTLRIRVKGPIDGILLEGGAGNDRLVAAGFKSDVPVTISGGDGNDRLVGGRGNDVLNDGAGDDVLIGGGGDDGLTNSLGRDKLVGGSGHDLLVSSSIDKGDSLDGGAGFDNVSFAQAHHDFAVRAKLGAYAQRIDDHGEGYGPRVRISRSVEDLEGTEEDDILIGDGRDNKLLGRGGADVLLGLDGDDRLDARFQDADRRLDGGRGRDRATLDPEDRAALRNVETRLGNKRRK